ncbi:MAG: type 1 glutamine amidotransferase [Rhodothermia bacterium]|nr:MAG: type 1 glutamine amidotransferase [Rhodothermia bacterium]
MTISFSDIRALLIQARNTPDMEFQEQECFVERTRLEWSQMVSLNVAYSDLSELSLNDYDVLFVGGAGEYSATADYPWMNDLLELIQKAHDNKFPTFGSCWGHQVIARALGGTVIHDPDLSEMGCLLISLTEAGKIDRLFTDFPTSFLANMGHHDRVTELPKDAIQLAVSESQPNEAFRMQDSPMYGTQFHSELDAHRERERLIRYRPLYRSALPTEEVYQNVMCSLAETTEVDHLMHDFLLKFVVSE